MRPLLGVVLAGGLASRMGGGDKGLQILNGRPILHHILDRLMPQVDDVILNANGDPARFADFGLPVVADMVEGFPGPLAGILSGMAWALSHRPAVTDIVTVPGDGPFLAHDLVVRLVAARDEAGADLACAVSDDRIHPVVGLWPVRFFDDLHRSVMGEGMRKVRQWTARRKLVQVEFPVRPVDPFFNINRPEDLAEAERLARLA